VVRVGEENREQPARRRKESTAKTSKLFFAISYSPFLALKKTKVAYLTRRIYVL
jgi:hypothetical protein